MALKPFHLLPQYWRFPQAKQLMYWQDAANILWCWNHETRRGERDGDLMTADRQGGTDSHVSSLCGTLLSDERSRTTPNSSHVLLIACPATHDSEDEFRVTSARSEPEKGNTVTFVLVFFFKNTCFPVGVFLRPALVCRAKGRAELCPSEWVCLVWVKAL